jgi:hypothetical protein
MKTRRSWKLESRKLVSDSLAKCVSHSHVSCMHSPVGIKSLRCIQPVVAVGKPVYKYKQCGLLEIRGGEKLLCGEC